MEWRSDTLTAIGDSQNTSSTATSASANVSTTGGAWTSSPAIASEALWAFSVAASAINVLGVGVNAALFCALMLLRRGGQLLGPSVQMLAQQAAVDLIVCAVSIINLNTKHDDFFVSSYLLETRTRN